MIIASYLLGAFALIGGIGLTVSSSWLITMAAQHPPILTLSVAIVAVRFFGISRSVSRYAERVISHKAVFDRLTGIRVLLFKKVAASSIKFIQNFSTTNSVKTLVDDVERAQEYQLRVLLPRTTALIAISVGACLGLWINFKSVLILGPVLLLTLVIYPKIISRNCLQPAIEIEKLENKFIGNIEASTYGITEAEIYGYLPELQDISAGLIGDLSRIEKGLLGKSFRVGYLTAATLGVCLLSLVYLAYHLSRTEQIPAVQVSMLIFLPLVLFEALTIWYPNLFTAGKLTASSQAVAELADGFSDNESGTVLLPKVDELEVQQMQVAWTADFMQPVSFTVKRGQLLVIRGRSGSGKTTLAMGLLGLLPYKGSIISAGIEFSNASNLSERVVGTVQRSHIFNTTIRENLKIAAPDCKDEDLIKVLEIVELTDLLNELPNGLDTQLGEFGRSISGGEAKRLSVARALLSSADVVILDEPTEHLDQDLALRLEKSIANFLSDRILIIITHSGWHSHDATLEMKALSRANS